MPDALSYLGNVPTGTRKRAAELLAALKTATGKQLTHVWGLGSSTEHATGRALDLMVFGDKAAGDWLAEYLWQHRARLGVTHLIWWQRIRSTVTQPGAWRPMADRGNPTKNHKDHIHVLFRTTAYTPPPPRVPAVPHRYPGLLQLGSAGAAVRVLQDRLRDRGWRIVVDGHYGPATVAVVKAFQKDKRLTVDGKVGPRTWAALWATPIT